MYSSKVEAERDSVVTKDVKTQDWQSGAETARSKDSNTGVIFPYRQEELQVHASE